MYQRDYILQMIEMLAELIAGILGLIKKGNYQQAAEMLENAYQNFLKQDAAFFHNIPVEGLTEKLLKDHNYTHIHLEVLAELMYAEAELAMSKNDEDRSLSCYEKSCRLLDFVVSESKTFSFDQQSKLESIREKIKKLKGK